MNGRMEQIAAEATVFVPLKQVAQYVSDRTDASKVNADTYVGVDNLLPNKAGKTVSSYCPEYGKLTRYQAGDILIGNIRPYLKKIWLADSEGGAGGDVLVLRAVNDQVLPKYLYYCLSSEEFFHFISWRSYGSKMPRGDKSAILNFAVPMVSLPTQQDIIGMLDKFVELERELERELECRRFQLEYYRSRLLFRKADGTDEKNIEGNWNE